MPARPLALLFLLGLALLPSPAHADPADFSTAVVGTDVSDISEAMTLRILKAASDACRGTALVVKEKPEITAAVLHRRGLKPRSCGTKVSCISKLGEATGARYVLAVGANRVDDALQVSVDVIDAVSGKLLSHGEERLIDDGAWKETLSETLLRTLPSSMRSGSGTLTVTSTEHGARVRLDGREIGKTPLSSFAVPPGEHVVDLVLEGFERARRVVEIEPGRNESLHVPLLRPPPPAPEKERPISGARLGAIAAGGATAVAIGVGIGFGFAQSSALNRYCERYLEVNGDPCTSSVPHASTAELRELKSAAEEKSVYQNIAFGLAGASAVTAGVLLYLDLRDAAAVKKPRDDLEPDPSLLVGWRVLPAPSGVGLALGRRLP